MCKQPLTLATAQSYIAADVRENGRSIRRLMQAAHAAGADLIHFSEGALSGYSKSQIKRWADVNWRVVQEEMASIAKLAGALGLWTVVGCNHRLTAPNRPHNSLYVISNQGEIHTRYDKRRCSHSEITDWYTPGNEACVFTVNGIRFGCLLCIEVQFPDLWTDYEQLDVDCLLFSTYSDNPMFGIQAQGHAACNNYWVSFSVSTNVSQQCPSRLIGPDGTLIQQCLPDQPAIIVNELDLTDPQWKIPLQYARPWRRPARRGEIYQEWYAPNDPRSLNKTQF